MYFPQILIYTLLPLWVFLEKEFLVLLATDVCLELTEKGSKQNAVLRDLVKCFSTNSFFPKKNVSVPVVLTIILMSIA